jgi:hypothetical protein
LQQLRVVEAWSWWPWRIPVGGAFAKVEAGDGALAEVEDGGGTLAEVESDGEAAHGSGAMGRRRGSSRIWRPWLAGRSRRWRPPSAAQGISTSAT